MKKAPGANTPSRKASPLPLLVLACHAILAGTPLGHASPPAQTGTPERKTEDDLFGAPPEPAPQSPVSNPQGLPVSLKDTSRKSDAEELSQSEPNRSAFASGEVQEDPLKIGGQYFLRSIFTFYQDPDLKKTAVSAPTQLDAYLDGRPSDRIRTYLNARLTYDPTRDAFSRTSPSTSSTPNPGLTPNNPQVSLDQTWMKFDIERTAFVTLGKQHVKWGAARYWNPADTLHFQRRDPLIPFDPRLGSTMAKFEFPWEAQRMNFYAVALFDNPLPASQVGALGGAFRVEKVIGSAELGIQAVFRGGNAPIYGLDFSAPIGLFDFYTEVVYLTQATTPFFSLNAPLSPGAEVYSLLNAASPRATLQASAGINTTFAWRENRQATLGFETFYNQTGTLDSATYPLLLYTGQFQGFYLARNYGAIYLSAEGLDSEKHTGYTLSTLANFSDLSFLSRFDFTWRFLTYLSLQAYVNFHYGTQGGEFNFSLSAPALTLGGSPVAALSTSASPVDLGFIFRLSF